MNVFPSINLNTKFEPCSKDKPTYDYKLEGLRGIATILVASHHVLGLKNLLDPTYHPNAYFASLQAGHGAVLLFFVLSGYVIGLTNTTDFASQKVGNYIIRRGLRLVPIYIIAVCLGVLLRPKDSPITILGNFFFLQNFDNYFSWLVLPIGGNPAIWSLNYEVLYYLTFIFIWWLRPKVITLFVWVFIVSAIGWFSSSFPQFIAGYASGWCYWLSGLWLAWKIQPCTKETIPFPLFSYILLFIATNNFATGKVILNGLGLPNSVASFVNLSDITILPICILMISEITRRQFYGLKYLRLLCFVIPAANILVLIIIGRLFEEPRWISSALFTLGSIALTKYRISSDILVYIAPLGSISYAFYILHMPFIFLIHDYFPWQGTAWSFLLGLLAWFLITLAASSLLELAMQPAIKNWFYRTLLQKRKLSPK